MAERSKALVLGTSLLGGVGSNPTPINVNPLEVYFIFLALRLTKIKVRSVCQHFKRIGAAEARWAHNPKVPGSKPGFASVPPSSVGRAQDS